MESTTTFADGLIVKTADNQPDFVIGKLSIKVDEFVKFINANQKNGWVNIDLLKGKSGKPYAKLNTYEAKTDGGNKNPNQFDNDKSELPF
jgi:glycerol-3-phosphate responsive antiterminator